MRRLDRLSLAMGLLFLYGPLGLVVLFSFNASRNVAVWGGFSAHWYAALLDDRALRDALVLSLEVAALSATLASILARWPRSSSPATGASGAARCSPGSSRLPS